MIKRFTAMLAMVLLLCTLCGCAGIFEKEYVSVEDYVPTGQSSTQTGERLTVRNFSGLKQAILTLVSDGEREGSIVFDSAYDGDVTEDMASACWQVRSTDALCAYCVDNISYELSKIVTYYEAKVTVSYASFVEDAANIVKLPYSTGVDSMIESALDAGQKKLVVLINRSSYSAEDMEAAVDRVYREYPATAPKAPTVSVNMYSGSNMQRLYEINLRYGMTDDELAAKKKQLSKLDPFADMDLENLSEGERALAAYNYLIENCSISSEAQGGNIYDALIGKQSDSEGTALAYVELCRRLHLECQIVYGQKNWEDHCWNIVRIDGDYYHVDAGLSSASAEQNFLKTDRNIWSSYRWDVSAYPACTGELTYESLTEEATDNSDETGSGSNNEQ